MKIARQGGGEKYQQRQREQGKLFVRDRIDKSARSGSAFLELSPLAAFETVSTTKRRARASSPGSGGSAGASV